MPTETSVFEFLCSFIDFDLTEKNSTVQPRGYKKHGTDSREERRQRKRENHKRKDDDFGVAAFPGLRCGSGKIFLLMQ